MKSIVCFFISLIDGYSLTLICFCYKALFPCSGGPLTWKKGWNFLMFSRILRWCWFEEKTENFDLSIWTCHWNPRRASQQYSVDVLDPDCFANQNGTVRRVMKTVKNLLLLFMWYLAYESYHCQWNYRVNQNFRVYVFRLFWWWFWLKLCRSTCQKSSYCNHQGFVSNV